MPPLCVGCNAAAYVAPQHCTQLGDEWDERAMTVHVGVRTAMSPVGGAARAVCASSKCWWRRLGRGEGVLKMYLSEIIFACSCWDCYTPGIFSTRPSSVRLSCDATHHPHSPHPFVCVLKLEFD